MSKNRLGMVFAAAFVVAALGGGLPAVADEVSPISLPTETSYENVNINTVGINWIDDGSTTIWTRGYAQVKLTQGIPVYAAGRNLDGGLLASEVTVRSAGTTYTFFNNTYGSPVTMCPSLRSATGGTVNPYGTWIFVNR